MSKSFNIKRINKNFFTLFGGKSQTEIASLLGVGTSAVNSWARNVKQVPWNKLAYAKELSGKSWDWMLGGDDDDLAGGNRDAKSVPPVTRDVIKFPPVMEIPSPKGQRIVAARGEMPVRGLAAADDSAGTRIPDTDESDDPIRFPDGLMGVPVIGDSMSPVILAGQYAIIDSEREGYEVADGIVVASIIEPEPGDDYDEPIVGTVVKRCERHENLYYFKSINSYSPFSAHVAHCRVWPVLGVWFAGKGAPPTD